MTWAANRKPKFARFKTIDTHWNIMIFTCKDEFECKVDAGTDNRVFIWR